MNCAFFKSPLLQAAFEQDGYAVLDLAGEDQLVELRRFYAGLQNAPMPGHGFQVSLDNEDTAFVQMVSEQLIRIIGPAIDRYFRDYQVFTASFVVKERNPGGFVPPHQDWTFVDESLYCSATVWCPLQDVRMENGALGLIGGSHHWYDHVRPSPSPQFEPPFKHQLPLLFPYIRLLELKAGQAVVFNNRTLHASPPNLSELPRVGFGIGITYKDAQLQHFYKLPGDDPGLIEGFAVDASFFYRYNNARLSGLYARGQRPHDLRSIGIFSVAERTYSDAQLMRLADDAGNRRDERLFRHVAALPGFAGLMPQRDAPPETVTPHKPNKQRLPFWKVYTPLNVYREIKYRLTQKNH